MSCKMDKSDKLWQWFGVIVGSTSMCSTGSRAVPDPLNDAHAAAPVVGTARQVEAREMLTDESSAKF